VIEPIAQVIIAPRVGTWQNRVLPNEDSLDLEFTDSNLFALNRYPGLDRLEGGTRFNVGVRAAWYLGGWLKAYAGETELAIEHFAHAMRLSPLDPVLLPWMQSGTAHAYLFAGQYDQAASWAEKALRGGARFGHFGRRGSWHGKQGRNTNRTTGARLATHAGVGPYCKCLRYLGIAADHPGAEPGQRDCATRCRCGR